MKFTMVHENYNVTDLDASIAFYGKALGLTECRRKTADDGSFILVYLKNEQSGFELELTWLRDHPQKYAEPAAAPAAAPAPAAPAKAADPNAVRELAVQVGADVLAKL